MIPNGYGSATVSYREPAPRPPCDCKPCKACARRAREPRMWTRPSFVRFVTLNALVIGTAGSYITTAWSRTTTVLFCALLGYGLAYVIRATLSGRDSWPWE